MSIEWLLTSMEQRGDAPAIVWQDQATSYSALLDLTRAWRDRLHAEDMDEGQVVAIDGDYTPNTCALLLALIERRAVIVPLTAAIEAHRQEFFEIAQVERVIAFDQSDGWRFERRLACATHPLICQLREEHAPGLIFFSSGSSGKSKASVHNCDRVLEKFKLPRQPLITLNFLMFDHMGGINTLFHTLSNGGTVVAAQSRDPMEVCRLVARHKVELLPASPTFLNLLLISEAYKHFDLSSLNLITYGTEVMPEGTLARLRQVFPSVRLQQTYGLSELGVLRSKSKSPDSLWVKVGGEGVETKVVGGTLWVRTRAAMLGYLNAPSPFDEDGWMNTEDLVEVDGEYMRILGRRSELINVGGSKVYPAEVESALMEMDNIRDAVVYGEPNPITGQAVVAVVSLHQPEDPIELTKRIRSFQRDKLARYKIPSKVIVGGESLFNARYKKNRRAELLVSSTVA